MPFCSSRIYTNITIEIFVKVNINTPRSNNNDLDLAPPPLPGLQNDKVLQYSEDTKLKSKESIDLNKRFTSSWESVIKVYRPTNRHAQSNIHHRLRMRA